MSKKIQAIQKDIVHRICSGQVVLNLATAIKELVENSLDANATIIDVRMKEYGSDSIEVTDNGTGIHPDNFQALTLKHHTSKLSDFSDLVSVETFGFRGEALSSLCALSDMTVTTRHDSEACGVKLTFDYLGELKDTHPFPRQVGTTVTLMNLFSSLPVRQKEFQRNLKKEFAKAVQLLSAYCLIANNTKITCVNQTKKGGRSTFLSTQENKTVRENISCVFGSKQLTNLLEIADKPPSEDIFEEFNVKKNQHSSFKLEGYISSCEHGCGRSTSDRQFYFINSRPCEPAKIMKLVNEVYHQYNLHQFPFVLMNIMVPKQNVDVNVTPDKRLIFLQNENFLLASVKSALVSLFENIPSTYKMNNPLMSFPNPIVTSPSKPSDSSESKRNLSISFFDKWRSSKDKGGNQKRSNQDNCDNRSFKQMKLEFFHKPDPEVLSNESPSEQKEQYEDSSSQSVKQPETFDETPDCTIKEAETYSDKTDYQKNEDISNISVNLEENELLTKGVDVNVPDNTFSDSIIFENVKNQVDNVENRQENLMNFSLFEQYPLKKTEINIISKNENTDEIQNKQKVEPDNTGITFAESEAQNSFVVEICDDTEPVADTDGRKTVVVNTSLDEIRKSLRKMKMSKREECIQNKFHTEIDPNKNQVAEEELRKEISKDMFLKMQIIGQFNLGFIITKLGNDLFIVDQHATDEKYNFETLQRTTSIKGQKLVIPQELDLTSANECILIDNLDVLNKNGFEFFIDKSAPATKKVKLVSIPVSHNWQFGKEDIDEMLFMLQDAPNSLCRPSRIRAMFASRACRKSVMIGTSLSNSDMRRLINHMSEIEQPWNCPHGRPTMRHLINLSLLK